MPNMQILHDHHPKLYCATVMIRDARENAARRLGRSPANCLYPHLDRRAYEAWSDTQELNALLRADLSAL